MDTFVWDGRNSREDFLGGVYVHLLKVPTTVPPNNLLTLSRFGFEGDSRFKGDGMLAVWMGTWVDETFPEAWQFDTGGMMNTISKVYLFPKLLYLRVNVIEFQDLHIPEEIIFPSSK